MELRAFLRGELAREIRQYRACPTCGRGLDGAAVTVEELESDPPRAWPARVVVSVACPHCAFTRRDELEMSPQRLVALGKQYRRACGPVSADDVLEAHEALQALHEGFAGLFAAGPAPGEGPAVAEQPGPAALDPLLDTATQEIERLREQLLYCRRAMRALVIAQGGEARTVRVPFRAIQDALVGQDLDELVGQADPTGRPEWVWTVRRRQQPGVVSSS